MKINSKATISLSFDFILLFFLAASVLFLYRGLFSGTMILKGDSVLWYGMFHYFAECLWNGYLPYWDPYVHGGEPFYYAWNVIRLSDPVTLIIIMLGGIFKCDLFLLYNVTYVSRIIICLLGCYLFIRELLSQRVSVICTSILIFWGPIGGQEITSISSLDAFCWFPWIVFCLLRAMSVDVPLNVTHYRAYWICASSYFFAINVGGSVYHWAYGTFVILVFLISLLIFNTARTLRIIINQRWIVAACAIFIIIMSTPQLALLLEKSEIYPAARNIYRNEHLSGPLSLLGVDYGKIATRDPQVGLGNLSDLLNAFPNFGINTNGGWYFGKFAALFMIFGIFFGKNIYKNSLLSLLTLTTFMYIGPIYGLGWLHEVIYVLFPPLWLTRHLASLDCFIFLLFAIFAGLGIERFIFLVEKFYDDYKNYRIYYLFKKKNKKLIILAILTLIFIINYYSYYYLFQNNLAKMAKLDNVMELQGFLIFIQIFALTVISKIQLDKKKLTLIASSIISYILIMEQTITVLGLHRIPFECNSHYFCETLYYFENFKFPSTAAVTLQMPTRRILGMNFSKSYLSYGPAIFKETVALEDIMPSAPPPDGSGKSLHINYPSINFPIGLYHFWLKNYLRVYEIGEWQHKTFEHLIGVNKPLIDFKTNTILSGGNTIDNVLKQVDGDVTRRILERAVIVEEPIHQLEINSNFAEVATLITPKIITEPYFKEAFENPTRLFELGWSLDHPDGQGSITSVSNSVNDDVKNFIRIKKPHDARLLFRYLNKNIELLRGKDIIIEILCRSNNHKVGAIEFDVQTKHDIGPNAIADYTNSGDWENIRLKLHIEEDAQFVLFTVAADKATTDDIELANLKIEMISPALPISDEKVFESVLSNASEISFHAKVKRFTPNDIDIDVDVNSNGVMTYRDMFTRDWTAYVDGKMVPIIKADLVFKGVYLDTGHHTVEFRYKPLRYMAAFYIYILCTVSGIIFLTLFYFFLISKNEKFLRG